MTKKSNTPAYLAIALLLLGGLGFLMFTGFAEDSAYFLNVSEALAMEPEQLGHARLFGNVAADNLEHGTERPGVVFTLVDKENIAKTLRVQYDGAVPDTFEPGVEVIVEGALSADPAAPVFTATTLMTKCPSKYEKDNRET